jgi:hypothetical protein
MPAATPTRPLPAAVREKLGKLLPMLSSSHNGERVGAVAANRAGAQEQRV